jgi:hypothetical protein
MDWSLEKQNYQRWEAEFHETAMLQIVGAVGGRSGGAESHPRHREEARVPARGGVGVQRGPLSVRTPLVAAATRPAHHRAAQAFLLKVQHVHVAAVRVSAEYKTIFIIHEALE